MKEQEMATTTNAAGFEISILGKVVPGSSVTGPTDPESPYGGRVVTLTAVRYDQVQRGQIIGGFAHWHQGGLVQPANLLSALMVVARSQKAIWEGHRYYGQRVTIERDDCSLLTVGELDDVVYEVTFH